MENDVKGDKIHPERIMEFLKHKDIRISHFERKINVSSGYFKKAVQRRTGMGSQVLTEIMRQYPDLNIDWVLTGRGEMLRQEGPLDYKYRTKNAFGFEVSGTDIEMGDHVRTLASNWPSGPYLPPRGANEKALPSKWKGFLALNQMNTKK